MTAQESKILRIQLYHPFMGVQNFDISSRQNFTDLRTMLSTHTQMTIFQNYRFELNGKLLLEFQEIGQAVYNETRINLVLQPFDQRSSCYHLDRVKDMLANPIQWMMLNSRQSCEQKQLPAEKLPQNVSIDNFLQSTISSSLYDYEANADKHINFLQQLNFSIHNPPPMYRKLAGDFYYLQIKTLEGREQHVTACPLGFYINHSTNSFFNTSNQTGIYFYNLFDLLKYLSPKFKQNLYGLKKIYKISELDRAIYSFFKSSPICEWLKNTKNSDKKSKYNQWKYFRSQTPNDNTTIKDWNQILQINSISNTDSQIQISNKQKNQYKLYQDFVFFAKQAAIKAVESYINCKESSTPFNKRVFYYGSVCVWFAQDDPLSYSLIENQKLTRRGINAEIRNLETLENAKHTSLNLKHTVMVSYRGFSVVVQTIVPGYDQFDKNKKCNENLSQNQKAIEDLAKNLRIQNKNLYKNEKNQVERAYINPGIKCIKGDDNRSYLLNLYGLSARDLNFPTSKNEGTYFRKELIPIFNQKQNCYRNLNTMIGTGYNLIGSDKINQQHMKMQSMKTFAQEIMVPLCIQSFLRGNKKYLADSKSIVKVMHKFGLGSRYLGSIYKKAANYEASHIKTIIQRVIIVKSLKNIFKQALRKSEGGDLKNTISRLLNCIFCSEATQILMDENSYKQDFKDQISTNASRKKKKKLDYLIDGQQDLFSIKVNNNGSGNCKPVELWESIKSVALARYGVKFTQPKIHMLKCLQNQFGKCALLRDICICTGIILEKTEYFNKPTIIFKPENIEQIKPLTKSITLKNKFLQSLIQQGDHLIQRKRIQQAIDIYNQAISFATSNFGIMTEELALLNKKVSQIYFRIGEIDTALLFIHCAQKMCEKIFGESYVQTLECYHLLSQFYFFMRNFQTAEYFLIKAIHISTVSYGEEYPELIIYYLNLGTVYETWLRFMDSITCISHALRIVLRIFGQNHINAAICYAAMSTAHFEIPDIQKSIYFQQKSIQIMKDLLREEDPRLKQAQKVLQYYNHLQSSKKVKENYEKQKKKLISNQQLYAGFPLFRVPPQCSPKDRELLYRKMQSLIQFPPKFFA